MKRLALFVAGVLLFTGYKIRCVGRTDDMLIVKGVNVFPASVKAIIERLHPRTTGQFRIVLDGPPPRVKPPLRIRVEAGRDVVREHAAALAEELGVLMHGELKIRSDIEIVPAGTLPRVTYKSQVLEYPGAR
ncbi:MAG: hypothetical protein HYU28_11200 [Actinobacteria bacterium]|nr:hypothetical protein [Actinomycetota bacterium]